MIRVLEINSIDRLAPFRREWSDLLRQTPGASFFQSLEWLEVYWRHFGRERKLRTFVVSDENRTIGILPMVVECEKTKLGRFCELGFPLHNWGAFYGPIGPDAELTLAAALEHVRGTPRDWDILELGWQGAVGTNPEQTRHAMASAGFPPYATLWDRTAIVDIDGTWDSYWSARQGAWLRRFRRTERLLSKQGKISFVHCRPASLADGDGSPHWDLYDACEEIARRSWQNSSTSGTTLTHESVRPFFREMHEAASAAGAADINLLLIDDQPVAFMYGYHYRGYVCGLRRGFDANRAKQGVGTVLLADSLRESFARGDRVYDMGIGSLESKRHFQTRVIPVLRYSHFPSLTPRMLLLRLRRWRQSRCCPMSTTVGRAHGSAADSR